MINEVKRHKKILLKLIFTFCLQLNPIGIKKQGRKIKAATKMAHRQHLSLLTACKMKARLITEVIYYFFNVRL